MRRLWIAGVVAVVAALSVAGIASAVNTYEVDIASGSPNAKGSASRPVPVSLNFGYEVADTDGLRPSIINQYRIAAEGIKYFAKARPTCTFAQASESPSYDRACRKAIVGRGTIRNHAGAPTDRSQKLPCDVNLTLLNISNGPGVTRRRGGMAIRIDTDDEANPPRCPIPVHGALAAPFFDVRIEGIPTGELRFDVPDDLTHPGGLDNSVIDVVSRVQRKTGRVRVRGRTRTVGYASAVGRRGSKRTVRVTFRSEDGQTSTATTTYPR
jgi:hypothetical protein